MSYEQPSIEVSQRYQSADIASIPDQYVTIIGPAYTSYTYPSDKTDIYVGTYDDSVDSSYTVYKPSGKTIKSSEIIVTLQDLLLRYYTHTAGTSYWIKSTTEPYIIESDNINFADYTNTKGSTYSRNASFEERDVKVGDKVYISKGTDGVIAKITELQNKAFTASTGVLTAAAGNSAETVQDPDIVGTANNPDAVGGGGLDSSIVASSYIGDITADPIILIDDYLLYCTQLGTADIAMTYNYAESITGVAAHIFDAVDVTYAATGYINPATTTQYYSIYIVSAASGGGGLDDITYEIYKSGSASGQYNDESTFLKSGAAHDGDVIAIEYGVSITLNVVGAGPDYAAGDWQKLSILASPIRFKCTSTNGDDVDDIVFPGRFLSGAVTISYHVPIGNNGLKMIIGDVGATTDCPAAPTFSLYPTVCSTIGGVTDAEAAYVAVTGASAGTYTGTIDRTFTVECTKGGYYTDLANADADKRIYLKVTTSDGALTKTISNIAEGTAVELGYGVTVDFANDASQLGIGTGDIFTIAAIAAYKGGYIYLKTDTDLNSVIGAVGDANPVSLDLFINKTYANVGNKRAENESLDAWTYTASTNTLALQDTLYLNESTWVDGSGNEIPIPVVTVLDYIDDYDTLVYIGSKYLNTDQANTVLTISDNTDADTYYGTDSVDNVIRHAIGKVFMNLNSLPIKAISLSTDDATGYTNALDVLETEDDAYLLVPLTQNATIFSLVEAHVNDMSSSTNKNFRTMIFSKEIIRSGYLFDQYLSTTTGSLENYTASIGADPLAPTEFTLVTMSADGSPDLVTAGVAAGDILEYGFSLDLDGEWSYTKYTIEEVLTTRTLRLVTGTAAAIVSDNKCRVKAVYTASETATAMADWAENTDNKRVVNIFVVSPVYNSVVEEPYHVAAAFAGLCSNYPAHKPMTNMRLLGFDRVYTNSTYTKTNLNTIAEGGNLIITQDTPSSKVYVRHQLTTDMSSMDQREYSLVRVLDLFSTSLWKAQEVYVGPYNVTPQLIDKLRLIISQVGERFTSDLFGILGPYIKTYDIEKLEQNATYKDRITEQIKVDLPEPFNHLDIYIDIYE